VMRQWQGPSLIMPTVLHSTPIKTGVPIIQVSGPDFQDSNNTIYEELKNPHNQNNEPMIALEDQDGETYDHLDFRRAVNELKPQYLSSESIKTERSRNSSSNRSKDSPGREQELKEQETVLSDLSCVTSNNGSSDQDWTDSVLSSFEKLNNSGSRTRKCIYKPESDLDPVNV